MIQKQDIGRDSPLPCPASRPDQNTPFLPHSLRINSVFFFQAQAILTCSEFVLYIRVDYPSIAFNPLRNQNPMKNSRILVVDDDELIVSLVQNSLTHAEGYNFQVEAFTNPIDALYYLETSEPSDLPDLIILDKYMPEITGDELISILKKDKKFENVAVIFLTGDTSVSHKVNSLIDLKADAYIYKPCTMEELLAQVLVVLRGRQELEDHVLHEKHKYLNIIDHGFEVPLMQLKSFMAKVLAELNTNQADTAINDTKFISEIKSIESSFDKVKKYLKLELAPLNPGSIKITGIKELISELESKIDILNECRINTDHSFKLLVDTDLLINDVIQPIIDNAKKYSGTFPEGLCRFRENASLFELKFTDHGPGIQPENLWKVFSPFKKEDSEKQGQNLGLSLAIAKKALTQMNAGISVQSDPGRNTTFTISFPVFIDNKEGAPSTPNQQTKRGLLNDQDPTANTRQLIGGDEQLNKFITSVLKTSNNFELISDPLLNTILKESYFVNIEAGTKLLEQGSTENDKIYFLLTGSLNIYSYGKYIITINDPGSLVGEIAPLTHSIRTADVVAETNCQLVEFSWTWLVENQKNTDFMELFTLVLIKKLSITTQQINQYEELVFNKTNKSSTEVQSKEERIKQISLFSHVIENSQDSIIIFDNAYKILFVNRSTLSLFQWKRESLTKEDVRPLFPDLQLFFSQVFDESLSFYKGEYETQNQATNQISYLEYTILPVISKNEVIALSLTIRDITEYRELLKSLEDYSQNLETQVEKRTRKINETNNELLITNELLKKQKEEKGEALEELKQTQSHLLQNEKMASIGQLAAGVAHEINNPTGFVASNLNTFKDYIHDLLPILNTYSELDHSEFLPEATRQKIKDLKEEIDYDFIIEDSPVLINDSLEGVERVVSIVQNLKDFSHADRGTKKYSNINDGIESTLKIIWNELKYKVTVETDYGQLDEIECYPQQLNQVFLNLFVNAAHAIEKEGTLHIQTRMTDNEIVVKIKDSGKGIDPAHLPHIFEPFFTTKEVGKGTGLGLSMAYNIIKKHNGEISVDSTPGIGTEFTIRLPLELS